MAFDFWETPLGRQMRGLPPAPPPLWKPSYLAGTISGVDNNGNAVSWPVSSQYLVTPGTAYHLAEIYGATVTTKPWDSSGGPVFSAAIEYILNWTDRVAYSMNAGMLAYYYCPAVDENDSSKPGQPSPGALANPDIVIAQCQAAINAARMDALRQVR